MALVKQDRSPVRNRTREYRNPFGRYLDLSEFFDNFWNEEAKEAITNYIPAVNIAEDNNSYFIELSAPGYRKEDLDITIDNNMLKISAERTEEQTSEEKKFSRREFSYGSFQRSFTLPDTVDAGKIASRYENGVLHIDLPKREEAKASPPRKIDIG